MRREFVMVLMFVLFSFSFAAAATCDDDNTIMRLYDSVNSHVSAWDQNVDIYTEEICYDSFFGTYFGNLSTVHDCNGANRILSLSSSSNAHASNVTDAVYAYEVCYGDLECSFIGPTSTCDGEIIASMSDVTNAHVAYAPGYDIKICCKKSSNLHWEDMNGDTVSVINFGQPVRMVASGSVDTTNGFDIYDEDVGFDESIRSDIIGSSDGSRYVGEWTPTTEDMEKAGVSDYDEFYFKIDGEESSRLEVSVTGVDKKVEVEIIEPGCGENYDEGELVTFRIRVSSAFSATARLKIDGVDVGPEFTNGEKTYDYTFDTPGNIQIMVSAENSEGNQDRVISNVMVLDKDAAGVNYEDGEYVAACIDSPEDFSDIGGSTVDFDASSTRGIRVDSGVRYLLVPGVDMFKWDWEFYDPNDNPYTPKNVVDDSSPDTDGFIFTREFSSTGNNHASLEVDLVPGNIGTVML